MDARHLQVAVNYHFNNRVSARSTAECDTFLSPCISMKSEDRYIKGYHLGNIFARAQVKQADEIGIDIQFNQSTLTYKYFNKNPGEDTPRPRHFFHAILFQRREMQGRTYDRKSNTL